jgi:hypothetical protein
MGFLKKSSKSCSFMLITYFIDIKNLARHPACKKLKRFCESVLSILLIIGRDCRHVPIEDSIFRL